MQRNWFHTMMLSLYCSAMLASTPVQIKKEALAGMALAAQQGLAGHLEGLSREFGNISTLVLPDAPATPQEKAAAKPSEESSEKPLADVVAKVLDHGRGMETISRNLCAQLGITSDKNQPCPVTQYNLDVPNDPMREKTLNAIVIKGITHVMMIDRQYEDADRDDKKFKEFTYYRTSMSGILEKAIRLKRGSKPEPLTNREAMDSFKKEVSFWIDNKDRIKPIQKKP